MSALYAAHMACYYHNRLSLQRGEWNITVVKAPESAIACVLGRLDYVIVFETTCKVVEDMQVGMWVFRVGVGRGKRIARCVPRLQLQGSLVNLASFMWPVPQGLAHRWSTDISGAAQPPE
jgi:hypothetical protein